jgi:hypothetical protein
MLSDNVAAAGETFPALFVTKQEHSIAYCRCREAVKLFRFLLSPYSLVGTCNITALFADRQSCGRVILCITLILVGRDITKSENYWQGRISRSRARGDRPGGLHKTGLGFTDFIETFVFLKSRKK